MRCSILIFALALTLSGLAFAQSLPGSYADVFTPRVSTPSLSFATPAFEVGASNATEGNVAGASSLSLSPSSTTNPYDAGLLWFSGSSTAPVAPPAEAANSGPFNPGASIPEDAIGVAQLTGGKVSSKPAVRKFTNADLQRTGSQ